MPFIKARYSVYAFEITWLCLQFFPLVTLNIEKHASTKQEKGWSVWRTCFKVRPPQKVWSLDPNPSTPWRQYCYCYCSSSNATMTTTAAASTSNKPTGWVGYTMGWAARGVQAILSRIVVSCWYTFKEHSQQILGNAHPQASLQKKRVTKTFICCSVCLLAVTSPGNHVKSSLFYSPAVSKRSPPKPSVT